MYKNFTRNVRMKMLKFINYARTVRIYIDL